ncbi:MAG TPA: DUF4336 domain-containing protein [Candidatus Limnocylindrales bacterium]|nr:DUF4336 domain-containing protein [Candidatus Limnocylindrales bacterium]
MKQIDAGLWIADQPLRVAGVELGARMTVVRLASGRLLLHSPIRPTSELVREARALGGVGALVAPNRFHHLFAADWREAFPDAGLFVAPGLDTKRPDLAVTAILSDQPDPMWSGVLEQVVLRGLPLTNEVVFFHPASRTLIATDLAFHIGPESPALTRIAFRLSGAYGRLAPTFLERIIIRDRAQFRASFERILAWPFERVIVAHGTVLESGGSEALAKGYEWL